VFVASSIGCALSGSVGTLIGARLVQGIGAALVLPLSLSLISDACDAIRAVAESVWA
jgi:MFS family permease